VAITAGEFFACVLLGTNPTALGYALNTLINNHPQPGDWTIANWAAALAQDTSPGGTTVETPGVVGELQNMLADTYDAQVFSILLTPVYMPDNNDPPNYSPTPLGRVLMTKLYNLGTTQNYLNVRWMSPPHPSDGDVQALISRLVAYTETS
jgi:hypothetical protein